MTKTIFKVLSIMGMFIISILAFTISKDPYVIIPAMSVASFDKPLWFAIIVSCGFLYLSVLWYIYEEVSKKIA